MAYNIDNTEFDNACVDFDEADNDEERGGLVLLMTLCRRVMFHQGNATARDRYFDAVGEKTALLMTTLASMADGVYNELRAYNGGAENETELTAEVTQGPCH